MKGIGLKEIAKIAGYSTSTVSKALNNNDEISEPTKAKIKELASAYNYIPNEHAIALRSKKSKMILVLLPQGNLSKYSSVVEELERALWLRKYNMLLKFYPKDISHLKSKNIFIGFPEGFIFLGPNDLTRNFLHHTDGFSLQMTPSVSIDKHNIGLNCNLEKIGLGTRMVEELFVKINPS